MTECAESGRICNARGPPRLSAGMRAPGLAKHARRSRTRSGTAACSNTCCGRAVMGTRVGGLRRWGGW